MHHIADSNRLANIERKEQGRELQRGFESERASERGRALVRVGVSVYERMCLILPIKYMYIYLLILLRILYQILKQVNFLVCS